MNEAEIKTNIIELLKRTAPDADTTMLKDDDDIRAKLGLDSFDHLRFIVALSEKVGIDIPEKDYAETNTLKRLIEYLKRLSASS